MNLCFLPDDARIRCYSSRSSDLSPVSRHRRHVNGMPTRTIVHWIDEKLWESKRYWARVRFRALATAALPIVYENKRNRLLFPYDRGKWEDEDALWDLINCPNNPNNETWTIRSIAIILETWFFSEKNLKTVSLA